MTKLNLDITTFQNPKVTKMIMYIKPFTKFHFQNVNAVKMVQLQSLVITLVENVHAKNLSVEISALNVLLNTMDSQAAKLVNAVQ